MSAPRGIVLRMKASHILHCTREARPTPAHSLSSSTRWSATWSSGWRLLGVAGEDALAERMLGGGGARGGARTHGPRGRYRRGYVDGMWRDLGRSGL